jgi:O-methyltransferase
MSTPATPAAVTVREITAFKPAAIAGKAALILLGLCASVAVERAGFHSEKTWLLIACGAGAVLLTIWTQHAIAEEIHDGVHQRLSSATAGNEFLSGLYSSMIGISFANFKGEHLTHHLHFGDDQDPDYPKYSVLPRGTGGWTRYFLTYFTGYAAARRILRGKKTARDLPGRFHWQHPAGTALLQLSLWAATAWLANPWWYPFFWFLPLLTLTYGLTQFRTLLEHYCDPASPYADKNGRAGAIYDLGGFMQAQLFAAQYGYNYHGTHHCLPSVPNYALNRVQEVPVEKLPNSVRLVIRSTYLRRIGELLNLSMKKQDNPVVMDSSEVASSVAGSSNLTFYLRTLFTDPGKILRGVWETGLETLRFVFAPRFPLPFGCLARISLLRRFIWAELKIPGGTTLLETIWLAYGTASATSSAKDWVEVGCFKGLSSARLSLLAGKAGRTLQVFDTFEGLPGSDETYDAVDGGVSYRFTAGSYLGRQEEVRANIGRYGAGSHVQLVAGDAAATLPDAPFKKISFAFLDVDLVESYKACFRGLASKIESGTLIVIHEACYRQIRELILDESHWTGLGLAPPSVVFIADRYHLRACRNLAFLRW